MCRLYRLPVMFFSFSSFSSILVSSRASELSLSLTRYATARALIIFNFNPRWSLTTIVLASWSMPYLSLKPCRLNRRSLAFMYPTLSKSFLVLLRALASLHMSSIWSSLLDFAKFFANEALTFFFPVEIYLHIVCSFRLSTLAAMATSLFWH